ncbi:MAG: phosphonate ABC transporter, permease protein PhnE [Spirochaetota bacterium]
MVELNQSNNSETNLLIRGEVFPWKSIIRYLLVLVLVGFCIWSFKYLNIPVKRFLSMWGPLGHKVNQLFIPPNFSYIQKVGLLGSIVQTFQLAFMGTAIGLVLCVPLSWFAAINMSPSKWVLYPISRAIIVGSRSIYWLIWAMLFTMILGFGPLAGAITCIFGTVGFAGKLMAEEIENIRIGPIEAIRATGGSELNIFLYGILPQVTTAWTGISIYTWDSTFRAATILGYVGAGGIGMYLRETIEMLEYEKTGMTLLVIIGLVVVSEVLSATARKRIA